MKTCLIVDDSRVIRRVSRQLLEAMYFAVDEAEHGEEALAKCAVAMPDVVLLDWNMPVMNGLEFLIALRQTPGGNVPKVVFCTTENDTDLIRKAIQEGADEYMMKPFDQETLQVKLQLVGMGD